MYAARNKRAIHIFKICTLKPQYISIALLHIEGAVKVG